LWVLTQSLGEGFHEADRLHRSEEAIAIAAAD